MLGLQKTNALCRLVCQQKRKEKKKELPALQAAHLTRRLCEHHLQSQMAGGPAA